MDNDRFDTLTKTFAQRRSRRSVLAGFGGAIAAIGAAALHDQSANAAAGGSVTPRQVLDQSAASAAAQVVENYYLAISTYDYKTAYNLFGAEMQKQQAYADFVSGYAGTAYDQVKITSTRPHEGHTDVFIELTAWHNDGSIYQYSGHDAVGMKGGNLRIIGAAIQEGARPTDVLPLCQVRKLDAALDRWQGAAGSRISALRVTNAGDDACLAAGVPHIQFYDNNGLLIDSHADQQSPITAVRLDSGDSATAGIRWTNWCGAEPIEPFSVTVAIPGDEHHLVINNATLGVPPCLGKGESSALGVHAFAAA